MPRKVTILPPIGGIRRRVSFQNQFSSQGGQYTSFDSNNFWPIDVKTGRVISAVRAPHETIDDVPGPVNLLQRVNGYASGKPIQSFVAAWGTDLYWWDGDSFVAATGAAASDIDTTPIFAATYLDKVLIPQETGKIQVFNYTTGAVAEIAETAGTAPVDVDFLVFHMGAIWAIVDNAIYVSRVGDPLDWDFSAVSTDLYGAFFFDNEFSGLLGGLVTAFIPQTNDMAIVSTVEGLLILRGHPRQGGVLEPLAQNAYVLGQGAWCQTPDGTTFFMSPLGLMSLPPNPGAIPSQVSRQSIPDELMGLSYDRDDPTIQMAYEPRWNAVLIYVRGLEAQSWYYDLELGGFHRMDAPSDILAMVNFPPFSTEQNSTVLHGRYDGISYYDKFGSEDLAASLISNPIKLGATATEKGRVDALQIIFARDTPVDVVGTLRVACGEDGQDAITRLQTGRHQYSVSLNTLKANYGRCQPKCAGHACVIAISTDTGDLGFEEVVLDITEAGKSRGARLPQIAVEGIPTDFGGGYDDLDTSVWGGYSGATSQISPSETLASHTHFLDLSLMPDEWWDAVEDDGRDIRVSTTSDVEIPCRLLFWDKPNKNGQLAFLPATVVTTISVRVWVGNPLAVPVTPSVFDEFWGILIPDGYHEDVVGLTDITRLGDAITLGTTPTWVDSPFGGRALAPQSLVGVGSGDDRGHYFQYGNAGTDLFGGTTFPASGATIVALGIGNAVSGFNSTGWELNPSDSAISGSTNFRSLSMGSVGGGLVESVAGVATASTVDNSGTASRSVWNHFAATFTPSNHTAFLNGVTNGSGTTVSNINVVRFGILFGNGISGTRIDAQASIQLHTTVRSAGWLAYQAAMRNQAAFWGSIGIFQSVNPPLDPPTDAPVVSCPTGHVSFTEVGSWTGYAHATPITPSGNLLFYTHFIDLDDMPAAWWSAVQSSGIDIRATDENDIPIPFCLVSFNKPGTSGFALVRHHQYESGGNQVRLWVGNASAVAVPPCSTYGAYAAFDSYTAAFYAGGSGTDLTGNGRTTTNTGTVSSVTGPIGNSASLFGASGSSFASVDSELSFEELTIEAVVKGQTASHVSATIAGVYKDGTSGRALLGTAPSITPGRFYLSDDGGVSATTTNSVSPTANGWWSQIGVIASSTFRRLSLNGGGTSSGSLTPIGLLDSDIIMMGARPNSVTATDAINVSLVGIHTTARPLTWAAYRAAMLNQATFWQTAEWTFASGTLTL